MNSFTSELNGKICFGKVRFSTDGTVGICVFVEWVIGVSENFHAELFDMVFYVWSWKPAKHQNMSVIVWCLWYIGE